VNRRSTPWARAFISTAPTKANSRLLSCRQLWRTNFQTEVVNHLNGKVPEKETPVTPVSTKNWSLVTVQRWIQTAVNTERSRYRYYPGWYVTCRWRNSDAATFWSTRLRNNCHLNWCLFRKQLRHTRSAHET